MIKNFSVPANTRSVICILCSLLGATFIFSPFIFPDAFSVVDASATQETDTNSVEVWWPSAGSHISGVQPFKGLYKNHALSEYSMYWQVDGGDLVQMYDSYADYPHKEATVDVTSWNWRGSGTYLLTFVIKDSGGNVVAAANRSVYIDSIAAATVSSVTASVATTAVAAITQAATPVAAPGNSIVGKKLYINPNSPAKRQADQWRASRSWDASLMDKIAGSAQAIWLGGWVSNKETENTIKNINAEAASQNAVPVYVLYNIPQRDCGSYSAGGANNPDGYRAWSSMVANAIGNSEAIVIIEPDSIAQITCLSSNDQNTRLSLLSDAVSKLKAKKNISVYIDAGHAGWVDADTMSSRLKSAGIAQADGFALNVSNFVSTSDNITYGNSLSQKMGNKHFVIDTSRNGNGSDGSWCNPYGRALGAKPSTNTGQQLVDAYLWAKVPGESDGTCNGGPSAGTWWPEYALGLASQAKW